MKRLICAIILICAAWPAWSEKRALVIGNAAYSGLSPLANTLSDAEAYAEAFRDLGFLVSHHSDLDELGMDAALSEFLDSIGPGDDVAFFYAGHGWSNEGTNYILPVDAPAEGSARMLARRSIALKNGVTGVLDEMRTMGAGLQLAIIDACRDNPFAADGTRSVGATRGLARVVPEQGAFVVFSAGEGQAALDRLKDDGPDERLSVFSRHFLPLLTSDMYLEDAVSEAQLLTARAAARQDHVQTPAYYDQTLGKTCLRDRCATPAGLAAPSEDRIEAKPSWSLTLDVPGLDVLKARDAIALDDGGAMIAYGYREFPGTPAWTGIARIDAAGNLLWDKRLEALKTAKDSSFLIVPALLPWDYGGAALFERPNLVSIDLDGTVIEERSPVPRDTFLHYPFPSTDGGFVVMGDGPLDRDTGDLAYRFVGHLAPDAASMRVGARLTPDEDGAKLYQTQMLVGPDGSVVQHATAREFRGYDAEGTRLWTHEIDGEFQFASVAPLTGGSALLAVTRDVTVPNGNKLARLEIYRLSSDGQILVGEPETLRFDKFAPSALLSPVRNGNGVILELTSLETKGHLFRRLDTEGRTLWSRNFGSQSGHLIATFADRGQSGAIFLDFREGEDKLTVIAVDDQGQ